MRYSSKLEAKAIFVTAQGKYDFVRQHAHLFIIWIRALTLNIAKIMPPYLELDLSYILLANLVCLEIEKDLKIPIGMHLSDATARAYDNLGKLLIGDDAIYGTLLEHNDGNQKDVIKKDYVTIMQKLILSHVKNLHMGIEQDKAGTLGLWLFVNDRKRKNLEQRVKESKRHHTIKQDYIAFSLYG